MIKVIEQYHKVIGECPEEKIEALGRVEDVARVCYQSQDKKTAESYRAMIDKLTMNEHLAMIEHSQLVITCKIPQRIFEKSKFIHSAVHDGQIVYAGNYRAFMEASGFSTVDQLDVYRSNQLKGEEIPWWAKAVTVQFITNRAMSHEMVRHRPASFGQLSQRYVDHTKGISFIKPIRFRGKEEHNPKYDNWLAGMEAAEERYRMSREYGESPQEARDLLPNSTMTEIWITASLPEWSHIFKLRTSKAADPTMRDLMIPVKEDFIIEGWA